MFLHWRIRTGSEWFSKILQIRSGSDSISSDQDWTRTEKFLSPLISGIGHKIEVKETVNKNFNFCSTQSCAHGMWHACHTLDSPLFDLHENVNIVNLTWEMIVLFILSVVISTHVVKLISLLFHMTHLINKSHHTISKPTLSEYYLQEIKIQWHKIIGVKLCALATWAFQSQQHGAVTKMWRLCQVQPSQKVRAIGSLQKGGDVVERFIAKRCYNQSWTWTTRVDSERILRFSFGTVSDLE